MKRFGTGWAAHVTFEAVATPVGEPCHTCKKPIAADDLGVYMPASLGTPENPVETELIYHRACLLYAMGINDSEPNNWWPGQARPE